MIIGLYIVEEQILVIGPTPEGGRKMVCTYNEQVNDTNYNKYYYNYVTINNFYPALLSDTESVIKSNVAKFSKSQI